MYMLVSDVDFQMYRDTEGKCWIEHISAVFFSLSSCATFQKQYLQTL